MSPRNSAVAILLAGLALNFIGKIPALRETWLNAALTGASVVVLTVGLYKLWKARPSGG